MLCIIESIVQLAQEGSQELLAITSTVYDNQKTCERQQVVRNLYRNLQRTLGPWWSDTTGTSSDTSKPMNGTRGRRPLEAKPAPGYHKEGPRDNQKCEYPGLLPYASEESVPTHSAWANARRYPQSFKPTQAETGRNDQCGGCGIDFRDRSLLGRVAYRPLTSWRVAARLGFSCRASRHKGPRLLSRAHHQHATDGISRQ